MSQLTAFDTRETPSGNAVAGLGRCRHCQTVLTHTFVDLGMSPLCESFLAASQLNGAVIPIDGGIAE